MEKSRKKEILENLCCKEIIFAFLCIIACVVLFFGGHASRLGR